MMDSLRALLNFKIVRFDTVVYTYAVGSDYWLQNIFADGFNENLTFEFLDHSRYFAKFTETLNLTILILYQM